MQRRSEGGERGCNSPGAESLWERQIAVRGAEWFLGRAKKSQQCHRQAYFLQYNSFASERPQFRTWGHQTCFLSRAPSNLVTPLQECEKCRSDNGHEGQNEGLESKYFLYCRLLVVSTTLFTFFHSLLVFIKKAVGVFDVNRLNCCPTSFSPG